MIDPEVVGMGVATAVSVATKVGGGVNVEVVRMLGVGRDAELRNNWNVHPLVTQSNTKYGQSHGMDIFTHNFLFSESIFSPISLIIS